LLSNDSSWIGARPVKLSFRIINLDTGRPIPGADVELIHPLDNEQLTRVKDQTSPDGLVTLTNLFSWYGNDIGPWRTGEGVSFHPWLVHVHDSGFSEFRASLVFTDGYDIALLTELYKRFPLTDGSLNLRYPVSGTVTIALRPANGDKRGDQGHR
jgi:hypothetical protein